MRILITTFTAAPEINGVSEVVTRHAEGLATLGHEVTIATSAHPSRASAPNVLQFSVTGNSNLRIGIAGEADAYQEFIRRWNGDIIMSHCWQIWSTDLIFPLLGQLRPKTVLVSHGFSAHRYPMSVQFPKGVLSWIGWQPYVWRCVKRMQSFDRVVFLAPLEDDGPYRDRKLALAAGLKNTATIPTGVDLREFDAAPVDVRSAWKLQQEKFVLCVSNYDENKNQLKALEVFAASGIRNADLVFVGSKSNEYARRLRARADLIAGGSLANRVHVLHGIERQMVVSAYRAADATLCASSWESGPLIALESMAAGTPVVSANVGFVRNLPGCLVGDSVESMRDHLRAVVENAKIASDLGVSGRQACEQIYNWPQIIAAYDDMLKEVVASGERTTTHF